MSRASATQKRLVTTKCGIWSVGLPLQRRSCESAELSEPRSVVESEGRNTDLLTFSSRQGHDQHIALATGTGGLGHQGLSQRHGHTLEMQHDNSRRSSSQRVREYRARKERAKTHPAFVCITCLGTSQGPEARPFGGRVYRVVPDSAKLILD